MDSLLMSKKAAVVFIKAIPLQHNNFTWIKWPPLSSHLRKYSNTVKHTVMAWFLLVVVMVNLEMASRPNLKHGISCYT